MSDREIRAELERVQGELKAARAKLAEPVDASALRTEVGNALDRLAQEAHAITPLLETANADLAAARDWLDRQKRMHSPGRIPRGWQRILWLFMLVSTVIVAPLVLMAAEDPQSLPVPLSLLAFASALLGWEARAWWLARRR